MLDNFANEIQNFTQWYIEVKSFLLVAEELDSEEKVYFQAYNELRYALDHFVRAILYDAENNTLTQVKETSTKRAISDAISHLQRAYSDIFEWYYLNTKMSCAQILQPYSQEQITIAIPNYYSKLRPKLDEIGDILSVYKGSKSSENNDITILSDYIDSLKSIHKTIRNAEGSLAELGIKRSEEVKQEKVKERKQLVLKDVLIPIITAVVGGGLAAFVIKLFGL